MIDQKAMFSLTHGMYIIGAKEEDGRFVGCIVDAVMQGATNPMLLCLSCMNNGYTQSIIEKSGKVSISVLDKNTDPKLIPTFGFQSSKTANKWQDVEHEVVDDLPILKKCCSYLTCKFVKKDIYNSHSIFTLEVLSAEVKDGTEPLTYTDYQQYFKNKVMEGLKK